MFLKIIGMCALSFFASAARAEGTPAGTWQVTVGGFSYHTPRSGGENEFNYGLGVEHQLTASTALQVGVYMNTLKSISNYGLVQYHPFEFLGFRFGASVGVVDGYSIVNNGKFIPVVLPSFSRQWKHVGINGVFVPPIDGGQGILFVGFKFPF